MAFSTAPSSSRAGLLVAAAAVPSLALGVWFGAPGTSQARVDASQAGLVLPPLLAAISCAVRARRSTQRERRIGWALLAVSTLLWAVASAIYAWHVLVLHRSPGFPSVSDGLYLAFALPAVGALIAFAWSAESPTSRLRALLDGLAIASALLFASWATVLGAAYRAPVDQPLAHATALAYPIVDMTLAALVLALGLQRTSPERGSLALVTGGLVAVALGDTAYVRANLDGNLSLGSGAWQALYMFGFLLVAAAALIPPAVQTNRNRLPALLADLTALAPLLLAAAVGIRHVDRLGTDSFLAASGATVVVLAVLRQLMAVADNSLLRGHLERLVEQRTAELERRTQELELSKSRLQAITQTAADAIVVLDAKGRVRDWNLGAERVFGVPAEEAVGSHIRDFVPYSFRALGDEHLADRSAGDGPLPATPVEVAGRRRNGTEMPLELSVSELVHGGETLFTGIMRDISARRVAELAAERERATVTLMERIAVTANQASDTHTALTRVMGMVARHGGWSVGHAFTVDETTPGRLVSGPWHVDEPERVAAFRAVTEATDFVAGHGLPGLVVATGQPQWSDSVSADPQFVRAAAAAESGLCTAVAFPILSRNEVVGVLEFFGEQGADSRPDLHELMQHVGTQLGRVVERARADRRLTELALHDPLTGLANRRLFTDRVEVSLRGRRRHGTEVGVLLLDLDGFKEINDSLGHQAGDELLLAVSRLLTRIVRASDTVARLGGDEFAIVLPDVGEPGEPQVQADRILRALSHPVVFGTRSLSVTASIGIAISSEGDDSAADLLRNADLAMYSAKRAGKGRAEAFVPKMHTTVVERLELEGDLRHALVDGQLDVYYQPIVDTRTLTLRGREALIRWDHPVRGLVPPSEFIPIAEASGLIESLGAWVLDRACADAVDWRASGDVDVTVSVNLSPRQVRPALVAQVARTLETSGLPPEGLVIEVTESLLMETADIAVPCLQDLHEMGVGLSIDDFGTGHSSLGRLRSLPVDEFKIDRSFIADVVTDPAAAAMVEAVIAMARALERRVVAEGVEIEEQLAFLDRHGCDLAQGFLIGRPEPYRAACADGAVPAGFAHVS